jgi:hypothetical protein
MHTGDAYYLDTCAVCSARLGGKGDTIHRRFDGREVRFCHRTCEQTFTRDLVAGLAALNARLTQDQLPYYPLSTSVVSGKALGDRPVEFFWGNRLVRLADVSEQSLFIAEPERFIEILDAACIARQQPKYVFAKCPVQGDILPGDDVELVVVANRMVRVCCHRCVDSVRLRPGQYLAVIDYANRRAARERGE